MVMVVTGIGFLIHLYSTGYMAHEPDHARFFAYLNLFTAAMLVLILADNLPLMFVGWEGVGLCSYLLIGFWYDDPQKAFAGRKAFITNRIGDFGFLIASFLLVLAAFALFWTGHFGWGLVAAWGMTFLDTVDGKLARVTLTSSKMGNVFDHGIDLIHPPFWWWAWLAGVQASGFDLPHPELLLAVIVGGYVAQRIEEGIFIRLFGMHMHAWRRFDSFFRLITARRNPNLLLLSAATLVGRPDIGLIAVGVWTALCLVVHAVQIVQGLGARRPLVSWLEG